MRDHYGSDYESVAADGAGRLIPEGLRRLAGAAMFVALIGAMGLWAYRLGTRDAAEVPIIRAMEGPTRVQPADPGGLQAAHQGLEVNAVLAGRPAPAPEQATAVAPPPALAAEDGPQGELVVAAPEPMPDVALNDGDLPMPGEDAPGGVQPAPDFASAMTAPAAPDAPTADENGTVDVAAMVQAAMLPAAPVTRPRVRPANLVVARATVPAAAPTQVAAAPRAEAPAPTPAAAPASREASNVGPGTRMVQLGAFDSEAITRAAWDRLVSANGDLLGSKSLYVERMTANARVFYRLRVAGFETADQTRVTCEALRARSIDCIPVTLQ